MWRNCAWSKHVNHFCFQNRDSNIAEEKSCYKVGSASAQRRTESSSQEGRRRTAAALWGRRWAVFEQNCCHRWNMDTRFWTTTEISVLSAEACNFSSPEKCRHQQLKVKPMMIVAYDKNGVIATDRVPTGSTVTAAHYRKFLQDVLHPKIRQKRSAMFAAGVLILHDNARAQASGAVSEILEKYGWQVLPHLPYSPDMRPPDFDLFPKLKKPLHGKSFRSIEEASNEVTRVIRRINNVGILTRIQDLPNRWTAMIKHNGDYIEGL